MKATVAQLKAQVEEKKREADRAKGRADAAIAQLQKEFSVTNLEEAKKLLGKLKRRGLALEHKLNVGLQKFEKRWSNLLK